MESQRNEIQKTSKNRRGDGVLYDLNKLKLKNWTYIVKKRKKPDNELVQKAETSKGLLCHKKKKKKMMMMMMMNFILLLNLGIFRIYAETYIKPNAI